MVMMEAQVLRGGPFVDGYEGLRDRFAAASGAYAAADPFPHAVFEGLVDPGLLRAAAAEFPEPDDMAWVYDTPRELKSAEHRWDRFGPATRAVVAELQSGPFVGALETLTGITGLIADPWLAGGGQHQIRAGGFLKVHADFPVHRGLGLARRLNVLLYLNEDWDPAWGGDLELWDVDMSECRVRIPPHANTLAVFSTTATSYHGHPDPLRCPPDRCRRSLAFYYYTAVSVAEADYTSTVFRDRPGEAVAARTVRERLRAAAAHGVRAVDALVPGTEARVRRGRSDDLFSR
jgi:hypothetical protein